MTTRLTRPLFVLAPLAAVVAILAQPLTATADDRDEVIRRGVYDGVWHTDKVKIIVEEVHKDGTFSGQLKFDKESRFPDFRCDFTGKIGRRDAIAITRSDCAQTAEAGSPRRERGELVWKGDVTGEYLDQPYRFELSVPLHR